MTIASLFCLRKDTAIPQCHSPFSIGRHLRYFSTCGLCSLPQEKRTALLQASWPTKQMFSCPLGREHVLQAFLGTSSPHSVVPHRAARSWLANQPTIHPELAWLKEALASSSLDVLTPSSALANELCITHKGCKGAQSSYVVQTPDLVVNVLQLETQTPHS